MTDPLTDRPGAPRASAPAPALAIFDMDGTLTRGETLLAWLVEARGHWRVWPAAALAGLGHLALGGPGDRRTRFKRLLLALTLRGLPVEQGEVAAIRLAERVRWNDRLVAALRWHLDQGHGVVVATGAAVPVARGLLRDGLGLSGVTVIGTELDSHHGLLTGRLAGPNRVRAAKAAAVADYIEREGPFSEIWGYGNAPHDQPMLDLVDHPEIV